MKLRVKLVPAADGTVVVLQYRWLGLFWRDMKPATNEVNRLKRKLMDRYAEIHVLMRDIERAEEGVKQQITDVHTYGDRLRGVGPAFHDNEDPKKRKPPVFVTHEPFIAPPPAGDYKKVVKAIKEGNFQDPKDFGVTWPPKDRPTPGGTRSAYIPEGLKNTLIAHGLLREGKEVDHIVGYRKPDQNQKQNQQQGKRKGGGGQQNQGGNQ